jgi:hypothetical protein
VPFSVSIPMSVQVYWRQRHLALLLVYCADERWTFSQRSSCALLLSAFFVCIVFALRLFACVLRAC